MSVKGFAPCASEASHQSASSATSSSHQPALKQLKALEENEDDQNSPQPLLDSTDEDLTEDKGAEQKNECDSIPLLAFPDQPLPASPVPNASEEVAEGDEEQGRHEADDFVPNRRRESTLETNTFELSVKPEVFDIGEDPDDTKKDKDADERGNAPCLHSLKPPVPQTEAKPEATSTTPASELVDPQPCTPATSSVHGPCSSAIVHSNSEASRSDGPHVFDTVYSNVNLQKPL